MAFIIMNLLVGLTVNKIEELMRTGEIIQASKRVEDLFGMSKIVERTQLEKGFFLKRMLLPIMQRLTQKKVI